MLDQTDRRLLDALRENARLPVATLAGRLGLARGTVQARLDRLVATGVIEGFTVRTRDQEAPAVRAVTLLAIGGDRQARVVEALRGMPCVDAAHGTSGRWDLLVELSAETLARLDDALLTIRAIDGVTTSETSVLLT